jgi:hypothetical protein
MKLLIASVCVLLIYGCTNTEKKADVSMNGAYKMTLQAWKNSTTDTLISSPHQLKIFTGDFVMYANINAPDSVSAFGVGSYTVKADTVYEKIIFSASDSTSDDTTRSYNLAIIKTDKGYKQVISNMGTDNFTLTEEYESAGTATASKMDGLWKLEKVYWINGKDTMENKVVQYKAYSNGYAMWGNVWTDSLNKKHTAMGYGTFTMDGNKVTESMDASTFAGVRGKKFDLDVEFPDADSYQQTIKNSDGSKSVELYRRMKK